MLHTFGGHINDPSAITTKFGAKGNNNLFLTESNGPASPQNIRFG